MDARKAGRATGGAIWRREFYARNTVTVARALLGQVVEFRGFAGRIVECEAYLGVEDLASHAARGITARTRLMYGEPGFAYVYLNYGMHYCLNFVTECEGVPGAVLIRALEPLQGLEEMRRRRGREAAVDLCSGPGKLTQAMGIDGGQNGWAVTGESELWVREAPGVADIEVTPRIGISKCEDWPMRFLERGSPFVSRLTRAKARR